MAKRPVTPPQIPRDEIAHLLDFPLGEYHLEVKSMTERIVYEKRSLWAAGYEPTNAEITELIQDAVEEATLLVRERWRHLGVEPPDA